MMRHVNLMRWMMLWSVAVTAVACAGLMSGCDEVSGAAEHSGGHEHDAPPPMQAEEKEALPPFIALGKEPNTVEILLVAAYDETNGGMNFNGKTRGEATFTVPLGWTVKATFRNRSAVPHSAVVVETEKVREFRVGEPYFKGAATPDPERGTTQNQTVTFTFKVDEKGKYAIACGFPTHALAGHWIYLVVGDENATPSYKSGDQTIEAKPQGD